MADQEGRGGTRAQAVDAAIGNLQRLAEIYGLRRAQLAREAGLTEAQWRVLEEIANEDFLPSLFARARGCTPAAISKILRQLQEAGLVRASIDAEDARQRVYELTAAGRARMQRRRRARERASHAVWEGLPRAELLRFVAFSETLAERLERYADTE